MKIKNIPFSVWEELDYLIRQANEEDSKIVVHKHEKFSHKLIEKGYLVFNEEDALEAHIDNYAFYRATDKIRNKTANQILEELTGKTIEEIYKKKTISIVDIPWDYYEAFENLNECDGYFSKVDLGQGAFRNALLFHGFIKGAGVNGYYCAGTSKLSEFFKSKRVEEIITIITGKTDDENKLIEKKNNAEKEINTLFELADKYGYDLVESE